MSTFRIVNLGHVDVEKLPEEEILIFKTRRSHAANVGTKNKRQKWKQRLYDHPQPHHFSMTTWKKL
jgi:hypothetical protein